MKTWREECGVMGVWNHEDAASICYLGLYAIQHRGQESAGIVSLYEGQHLVHKGLGLVGDVFQDSDLVRLKGDSAIGHVRYSTQGGNLLANAQPLNANLAHGPLAIAHNGNIVNAQSLRKSLQLEGAIFSGSNDTEILLHLIARNPQRDLVKCVLAAGEMLTGAFSLVLMSKDQMVAARDPWGFRPLVVGVKENGRGEKAYFVASETCAFDLIGCEFLRELEPGEVWWVNDRGEVGSAFFARKEKRAQCVFEHVYFARPDSVVFGQSVYEARKTFGRILAKESGVEADVVIPVPDSGVAAALGYSEESKVPFDFGIIRNHYVGRTFIQPHQSIRSFGVKIKLNPQSAILRGKRVVVVDDSLVRGTTSKKIIELLKGAGAREVHMRIAAPPTRHPCFYGVDTPSKNQLIASVYSEEEIGRFIGADSLSYLSIESMLRAVGDSPRKDSYCAACFDGAYPTPT